MEHPSAETTHASLERLRHEVEELRRSRERLVLAARADRRGLERELHDGLQQDLVALATSLQLARRAAEDDPAAVALLGELEHDLRRALDAAAALADRIWPPLLDAHGLAPALRVAAARVGAAIRIELDGPFREPIAGAVYFCCVDVLDCSARESLTTVAARRTGDTVVFELEAELDETPPGDAAVEALSVRLRDRIEALGGTLAVTAGGRGRIRFSGTLPVSRCDQSLSAR